MVGGIWAKRRSCLGRVVLRAWPCCGWYPPSACRPQSPWVLRGASVVVRAPLDAGFCLYISETVFRRHPPLLRVHRLQKCTPTPQNTPTSRVCVLCVVRNRKSRFDVSNSNGGPRLAGAFRAIRPRSPQLARAIDSAMSHYLRDKR